MALRMVDLLRQIRDLKVLVVGDICLDAWCTYEPAEAEPSRETGLPRVAVVQRTVTPGAAGTVASNLVSLGVETVSVLGCIGEDGHGHELVRALGSRGISAELAVITSEVPTFTYTKLINGATGREDLPRVDYISPRSLPDRIERQIAYSLRQYGLAFDVVIVSDQTETEEGGVITPAVRSILSDLAKSDPERVIWADSRRRAELFRNVILKPNRQEADEACGRAFGRRDYPALRHRTEAPLLVITGGLDGAWVVDGDGETHIPTRRVERPVDICGAGDSFSAGAALAYAVTRNAAEAVGFGNLVASITIMKPGTGTATPDELLAAAEAPGG